MLIDASWPSNSDAAVTKRTRFSRLVDERRAARVVHGGLLRAAARSADRARVAKRKAYPSIRGLDRAQTLHYVYVNVN